MWFMGSFREFTLNSVPGSQRGGPLSREVRRSPAEAASKPMSMLWRSRRCAGLPTTRSALRAISDI